MPIADSNHCAIADADEYSVVNINADANEHSDADEYSFADVNADANQLTDAAAVTDKYPSTNADCHAHLYAHADTACALRSFISSIRPIQWLFDACHAERTFVIQPQTRTVNNTCAARILAIMATGYTAA